MSKVLITDNVAAEGVALLQKHADVDVKRGLSPDELIAAIPAYDALVVRSETKVTEPVIAAGDNLQVVARAGIGVDNIDLDAATRAGVAVVNAPIGNTVAAAEHTVALMLALARNVPQAYASMKEGQWQRSAFMGIEVRNKTLGIIGLGRVGSEVARRAASFGMRLVAYDPFVAPDFRLAAGRHGDVAGRTAAPGGLHHPAHAADGGHDEADFRAPVGDDETRRPSHQRGAGRVD